MSFIRTVIIGTNPPGQLRGGEQPIGFDDRALTMDPFRFDRIEPGTLRGQKQRENAHAFPCLLYLPIVFTNPGTNDLAVMPGGVVPDQQPRAFALPFQLGAAPVQKLRCDITHRAPIDEAQRHLIAQGSLGWPALPQHPIARQSFGIGIMLLPGLFHQTDGIIARLPSISGRQGKAAPPHLVEKTNRPGGSLLFLRSPVQQSVASGFFSWYHGSGLVIQCLARFQLIPNRRSVWRIASILTGRAIQPWRTHCWTSRSRVHKLVSKPKSRGGRCNSALTISTVTSARSTVGKWWGRLDPAWRAASPCWLKA